MLHTKFQASQQNGSEEEDISEYFSMYFYGLSLGPFHVGPSWTLNHHLYKIGKRPLGNAIYTKFQASKPSGSEEEDFLIFVYVFLWFEPRAPSKEPSWIRGPSFEQNW